ncbi:hypothetical protein Emed_006940 [Eimeria media]
MRATTEQYLALERQPDEELSPFHEASPFWSGESGTLKWLKGVRLSTVSPAFAIISVALLVLVVLRSLCTHITSKQKESLGLVERRLAAGGDDEGERDAPSPPTPEICMQIQQGLQPVNGSETETAPTPSPPPLTPHPLEEGTHETPTGPEAKESGLGHEAPGDDQEGAEIEWPEISANDIFEGMMAAEDDDVGLAEWLLDPEQTYPFYDDHSYAAQGFSGPRAGGSGTGGSGFQGAQATRHWKPMSSDSEESDSGESHSQPSSPSGSESIGLPEPAGPADKSGGLELAHLKESPASDSSRRASSSSTSSASPGEPLESGTSPEEAGATPGGDPAEAPSTSSASAGGSAGHVAPSTSRDPFYRVPLRDPSIQLPPFDYHASDLWAPSSNSLSPALVQVRNILVQQSVDFVDGERLQLLAAHLVRLGKEAMPNIPSEHAKAAMVRALACRFLLMDALWGICETVGPPMKREQWWPIFAERLLGPSTEMHVRPKKRNPARAQEKLLLQLQDALLKFRQGVRPSAEEAQTIKRALFCGLFALPQFKDLVQQALIHFGVNKARELAIPPSGFEAFRPCYESPARDSEG